MYVPQIPEAGDVDYHLPRCGNRCVDLLDRRLAGTGQDEGTHVSADR